MKYSIYNTILPLSEKLGLVYCGSTDQFIVYQRKLTPLLESVSANRLAVEAPALYAELIRGGGIVPDRENEFENLQRLADETECSPKSYRLILNPTMDCNFKCWYCYENHISGSKMKNETLHRVLLMISDVISQSELETFELSFFGGEPLLHYDEIVRPIIDHCRQECQRFDVRLLIGFTSNGYLIDDTMIAHLMRCDEPKSFQITLDGNRRRHDKTRFPAPGKGSYNTILANVRRLLDCGFEVILRINYTASNILSIKDVLKDLNIIDMEKRKMMTISFHRVWQDRWIQNLPDSEVADVVNLFREEFPYVGDAFSMNNLRNPCYADKLNEAVINFDGNVFKCTARDFSTENRCGVLTATGQITWDKNVEIRRSAKLNRQLCRECRILPLCGGGCSQKAIESAGEEVCIEGLSDEDMNKIVMQRFYDQYIQ